MQQANRVSVRGFAAGFLAATVVVLWFFVLDLFAGQPLRTPAFLAEVLFGLGDGGAGIAEIAAYTGLHFLIFLAFGLATAWLLSKIETRAHFRLGIVLGFLFFDLTFYASVLITGANVLTELGWPAVFVGDLLAGVVLLECLRLTSPKPHPSRLSTLWAQPVFREGIIAGLRGASAVAASFLVIDVLFRQPFFTPASLGSAVFLGAGDAGAIEISAPIVLGYSALHFLAFGLIGLGTAIVLSRAEDHPALLLGLILVFVTFETVFIGLVAIGAAWILDEIGWSNVLIGNVIASLVMLGYFMRGRPKLWRLLWEETLEVPA